MRIACTLHIHLPVVRDKAADMRVCNELQRLGVGDRRQVLGGAERIDGVEQGETIC